MGTYTADNQYLTTTFRAIVKDFVDMNAYPQPLLDGQDAVHGKGKPMETGGNRVEIEVNFSEHSQITALSTGYEAINLNITDVGLPGFDDWALFVQPVVMGPMEEQYNQGDKKIFSILENRSEAAMEAMRRNIHLRLWGKSNVLSDLNTLNGDDFASGLLETASVGAQSRAPHGISKATYSSTLGWQNQSYDMAGSFSGNGLVGLWTVDTIIRSLGKDLKGLKGYISLGGQVNLKRAVNSNERYVSEKSLDSGVLVLEHNGVSLTVNRDMPNAGTATGAAGENEWTVAYIDHKRVFTLYQGDHVFKTGEFSNVSGKFGNRWAPISWWGQLMTNYLGTSAVIKGGDAF